jgi:predicted Rossmann fold nucleotide-binding protein DprA/Smf involved in DNA uptake
MLIKKGFAKSISSAEDILEELNLENKLKIKKVQMDFE